MNDEGKLLLEGLQGHKKGGAKVVAAFFREDPYST